MPRHVVDIGCGPGYLTGLLERSALELRTVIHHTDSVGATESYAAVLLDAGLVADVWETTYLHVLQGEDPVLEWMRGTGLRPLLAELSPRDA